MINIVKRNDIIVVYLFCIAFLIVLLKLYDNMSNYFIY